MSWDSAMSKDWPELQIIWDAAKRLTELEEKELEEAKNKAGSNIPNRFKNIPNMPGMNG